MQAAFKLSIIAAAAVGMAGCHKQPKQPAPADQTVAIDNGIPANAEIETLPPDESSQVPANELDNSADNADVNATSNSNY